MADAENDPKDVSATTASSAELSTRFVVESGLAAKVARLIEPTVEGLGYRLVRVSITGKDTHILQIMAERPDGSMAIGDCETISRQLSPLLDANDPLSSAYRLEVSSPGIDRPLVRPSDFETWAGYEARIEMREPVAGRKRFRGVLDGYDDGEARIAVDLEEVGRQVIGLKVSGIAEARLMLTDELVRESLRRAKAAGRDYADGAEIADDDLEAEAEGASVVDAASQKTEKTVRATGKAKAPARHKGGRRDD